MIDLTLYTNPMSRGQMARWALEETGQPYEDKIIQYGDDMKSSDYRLINPMMKVPAVKHGNKVITEVAAICAYLADAFPEAGLAPDTQDRADYYRWLFFAAGPIESAITNKAMGWTPDVEQERMAGYGNYNRVLDVLSEKLQKDDYVCGDRFTIADVYVGSHVTWGLQFGSMEERPGFKEYSARVTDREPYRKAKAKDTALMPKQS